MALTLFSHPFSAYCQKVLIALYEKALPFSLRELGPADPAAMAEVERRWPLRRFPMLVDGDSTIVESSIIIEHLDCHHDAAPRLVPADPVAALDVRLMDRVFDLYVAAPMQRIVADSLRAPADRDAKSVTDARAALDVAYGWLDARLAGHEWAAGETFSLADCAGAPALFYADWTHEIATDFATVRAYRNRLLTRPSFARCVEEARPYRSFFPLGAPDRD